MEIHYPDLQDNSAATRARFASGHEVGDIARKLYDPNGKGQLIDPQSEGFNTAFESTQSLLQLDRPIFEASFRT